MLGEWSLASQAWLFKNNYQKEINLILAYCILWPLCVSHCSWVGNRNNSWEASRIYSSEQQSWQFLNKKWFNKLPTLFLIRVHNATVKWHQAQQASNQHPAHNDLCNLVCVCSVTWAIGVIPCHFGSLPCSKTFECEEHLTGKTNEPIPTRPPPFLPPVIKRKT